MNEIDSEKFIWLKPLVPDQDFSVQFRDDHVHVELDKSYRIDPQHREALWSVLGDTCERHGSRRVLVEGTLPTEPLETTEVISAGQKTATVPSLWIAFAVSDHPPIEQIELYERIAASRGARVKFFDDRERALNWLRQNAQQ